MFVEVWFEGLPLQVSTKVVSGARNPSEPQVINIPFRWVKRYMPEMRVLACGLYPCNDCFYMELRRLAVLAYPSLPYPYQDLVLATYSRLPLLFTNKIGAACRWEVQDDGITWFLCGTPAVHLYAHEDRSKLQLDAEYILSLKEVRDFRVLLRG